MAGSAAAWLGSDWTRTVLVAVMAAALVHVALGTVRLAVRSAGVGPMVSEPATGQARGSAAHGMSLGSSWLSALRTARQDAPQMPR